MRLGLANEAKLGLKSHERVLVRRTAPLAASTVVVQGQNYELNRKRIALCNTKTDSRAARRDAQEEALWRSSARRHGRQRRRGRVKRRSCNAKGGVLFNLF